MAQVIVDESLLREPNLWVPGKKPLNYRMDWAHPRAPRIGCWLFDESPISVRNLSTGARNSIDATTQYLKADQRGRYNGWTSRSSAQYIQIDVKQTTGTFTFEWLAEYPSSYSGTAGSLTGTTIGSVYYFDVGTTRFLVGHDTSTDIGFYDGAWSMTGYSPCGVSGYQHIIFAFNGTSGVATMWVNGVQKYSAATYTSRSWTSSDAKIFGRYAINGNAHNPINFKIQFYCIHDKALTAGEVAGRTADPYEFLIPA